MKKLVFYLAILLVAQITYGQMPKTFRDSLETYFDETKLATKKWNQLWDLDLNGPILLVNPGTRELYSNYPDSNGLLKQEGKIYAGNLPAEINIANTSLTWNGTRWAMIILPLPASKSARINLLAHELFHRAQRQLGFDLLNPANIHLDQKDGRIYLRLELEALIRAVNSSTRSEIKTHLIDALTFRKYRYSIFPGADSAENSLELNEGIAEYTGFIMSERDKKESTLHFNQSVNELLLNPTFVRSFAYQTIPVYGYLLHFVEKYWNKNVTAKTNLTDYFIKNFRITINNNLKRKVDILSMKYKGEEITREEEIREEKIKKQVAEYITKFVEQPHFVIKFEQMNVSFDPRNILPVEDKGTLYPNIRISDKWGILLVEKGALMSPGWDEISISIPTKIEGKNISGDGWILTLNDGYSVVNKGNWELIKR